MDAEDRLFGEIAIKLGVIERSCLAQHAALFLERSGQMGAVLMELGLLTAEQEATVRAHQQRIQEKRLGGRPVAGENSGEPARAARHSVVPQTRTRAASGTAPGDTVPKTPYLHKVLEHAVKHRASDLHVHSGSPLKMRVHGSLVPLKGDHVIAASDAEKMVAQILTDQQWQTLAAEGQLDFAYALPGIARFRVNVYRQHRGMDIVFRIVPSQVPRFEDLGLPESLNKLTDFRTGLVLCTGPSGCGKSTTLAAMLGRLVASRKEHIITVENPVEFLFESTSSLVNQRQLHDHTLSFDRALRAALREDPDVIAITELRDRESMGLALSAAETGHLVLGTLHTGSAGQTISRIVNAFPAEEQGHIRGMLSESLRAVVSQRLVPRADGTGRAVAIEVLLVTTAVSNMIRDNKTFQLPSVMQTGKALGMITLDSSLQQLVAAGTITKEQAYRFGTAKELFS